MNGLTERHDSQNIDVDTRGSTRMTQELDMTAPAKIFKSETRRDIKVIETSFLHLWKLCIFTKYEGPSLKIMPAMPILVLKYNCP